MQKLQGMARSMMGGKSLKTESPAEGSAKSHERTMRSTAPIPSLPVSAQSRRPAKDTPLPARITPRGSPARDSSSDATPPIRRRKSAEIPRLQLSHSSLPPLSSSLRELPPRTTPRGRPPATAPKRNAPHSGEVLDVFSCANGVPSSSGSDSSNLSWSSGQQNIGARKTRQISKRLSLNLASLPSVEELESERASRRSHRNSSRRTPRSRRDEGARSARGRSSESDSRMNSTTLPSTRPSPRGRRSPRSPRKGKRKEILRQRSRNTGNGGVNASLVWSVESNLSGGLSSTSDPSQSSNAREEGDTQCGECEKAMAVTHCDVCALFYCPTCDTAMHRKGTRALHIRTSVGRYVPPKRKSKKHLPDVPLLPLAMVAEYDSGRNTARSVKELRAGMLTPRSAEAQASAHGKGPQVLEATSEHKTLEEGAHPMTPPETENLSSDLSIQSGIVGTTSSLSEMNHVNSTLNDTLSSCLQPPQDPRLAKLSMSVAMPRTKGPSRGEFLKMRPADFVSMANVNPVKNVRTIVLDDFEVLKGLGSGQFGRVVMAKRKDTQRIYAIKIVKKPVAVKESERLQQERDILVSLAHPFIVKCYASFASPEKSYFVLQYVSGGDLFFHLQRLKIFTEEHARFCAAEIALALGHLHKHNYIYRDLKLENVLVDRNGHLRLTDFGLTVKTLTTHQRRSSVVGTPHYLAPEVVAGGKNGYDRMIDYYALGVLCYEMMVGRPPFHGDTLADLIRLILRGDLMYPNTLGRPARSLIGGLLVINPKQRLGREAEGIDLREHRFFSTIDWKALYNKEICPVFVPETGAADDARNFTVAPQEFENIVLDTSAARDGEHVLTALPLPRSSSASSFWSVDTDLTAYSSATAERQRLDRSVTPSMLAQDAIPELPEDTPRS